MPIIGQEKEAEDKQIECDLKLENMTISPVKQKQIEQSNKADIGDKTKQVKWANQIVQDNIQTVKPKCKYSYSKHKGLRNKVYIRQEEQIKVPKSILRECSTKRSRQIAMQISNKSWPLFEPLFPQCHPCTYNHIKPNIKSNQIQIKSKQIVSNQIQIKSNQIKYYQVKPNQTKSNQIKSNQIQKRHRIN